MCKVLVVYLIMFIFFSGCAGRFSADRRELQGTAVPPTVHTGERGGEPMNKTSKSSGDEGDPNEYQLSVNRLLSLVPSAPPFEIQVWTERETYHVGEEVTFFFRSGQDAHLTLIDIDADGAVKILFPNAFHENGIIRAGRIYSFPAADDTFDILAEGPPGVERIKAIATPAPLSVSNADLASENDGEKVQQLLKALGRLDGSRWAEGRTDFLVIEKGAEAPSKERPREMKPKKPEKPIDITGTPGVKQPDKSDKRPMNAVPSPEIGPMEKKD